MTSNDSPPPVIKVLQINLNHSWTAQQLMAQAMVERRTDVALISDYDITLRTNRYLLNVYYNILKILKNTILQ
jgi:hypothetical protein